MAKKPVRKKSVWSNSPKLNPRQKRFIEEYLKDQNATQAYLRVYGGDQYGAETSGPRLLGNVRVKVRIERGLAKIAERANITAEKNLRRIAEMAYDTKKIRPSDILKACELVGRTLGQFKDQAQVNVSVPITNQITREEFKKKKKDFEDECS